MFVQIFRSETMFVVINIDHIVLLEPVSTGGCRVVLSNGTDFHASESYEVIIKNIELGRQ